jgi:hypothetical protein
MEFDWSGDRAMQVEEPFLLCFVLCKIQNHGDGELLGKRHRHRRRLKKSLPWLLLCHHTILIQSADRWERSSWRPANSSMPRDRRQSSTERVQPSGPPRQSRFMEGVSHAPRLTVNETILTPRGDSQLISRVLIMKPLNHRSEKPLNATGDCNRTPLSQLPAREEVHEDMESTARHGTVLHAR